MSSKIHEVLRKWTPITMTSVSEEELPKPVIYEDYLGTKECLLNPGDRIGLLTCIGYSHVLHKPYVFRCECGREFISACAKTSPIYDCGCLSQASRTAYLIRLRIETLRSWCAMMNAWIDDMEEIKKFVKNYERYIPLKEFTGSTINLESLVKRVQKSDCPLDIDVAIEETPNQKHHKEYNQFMELISMSPEYSDWLREMSNKLYTDYPAWVAAPMSSLQGYEIYKREAPEFDAATYINFINYLIDEKEKKTKTQQ